MVHSIPEAVLSREHDDANIICLPGGKQIQKKFKNLGLKASLADAIIAAFLTADFFGKVRHRRRLKKIAVIEKKNFR